MAKEISVKKAIKPLALENTAANTMIRAHISKVREEVSDSSYIEEAVKVLAVKGYRSAIGAIWNAVVDDLRNKIIARSLPLFNKSVMLGREIKDYDDFQNHVNDDVLIEGAYKTGVLDWEASKILKHCKEIRHIFAGHPRSSEPSATKVAIMIEDCVKYVLGVPYPPTLIDINDYLEQLKSADFDRNEVAIENAVADLPELYKAELGNRLFTAYIHPQAPSTLLSNIELVAPYVWRVLAKTTRQQIVRRVDQELSKSNAIINEQAFAFVSAVEANAYLSVFARKFATKPLIEKLAASLDDWNAENEAVRGLEPFADVIPRELVAKYVEAMTATYIGHVGSSSNYARTDFYANTAAIRIPLMFEKMGDQGAEAFIDAVRSNRVIRRRINSSPQKMRRLRSLARVVQGRASTRLQDRKILEALVDEAQENKFRRLVQLGKVVDDDEND